MPRTSQAALVIVSFRNPTIVEVVERLQPPDELDEDEKTEFRRVINSMPADSFWPGNMAILVQYCRHVVMIRTINQAVKREAKHPRGRTFRELVATMARETKIINSLMTSLRMTPQSTVPGHVSAKKAHKVSSPMDG